MKKQIIKLYIRTTCLVLILGLIIFFIYGFITCNQAKDTFFMNAEIKKEQLVKDIKSTIENIIVTIDDYKDISFGELAYLIQSSSNKDTYIEVTDSKGRTICTNNNCYPADFNQKGVVSFEDFSSQLSDRDYKEIISYLEKEPTGKEQTRYILSCSRYNVLSSGRIIPTELQILLTEKDDIWYIQNDIIKTYRLNKDIKKYTTENDFSLMDITVGAENSNELPLEFVKGNYSNFDNIKSIKNNISDKAEKEISKYAFGYFDYAYNKADTISFSNIETGNNNFKNYYTTSVTYTESFNTLDYAFDDLVKAFWFIIILFTITGFLISFISARTLKKQYDLEEKRRQLTRGLAHDLKTPLFIIRGYAENLKNNIHTEKREHYAEKIINQTDEMDTQIQTMLSFDKLQNTVNLHKTNFDLSQALTEIISAYHPTPLSEIEDNITINADKEMIHHLITNLIGNAYQHTTDEESIKIKLTTDNLTVSNKAENIKKSDLKNLWEPYYTMDTTRKNRNGLGLSIVKNIAEQHKFTCISEIKGDTITFGFSFTVVE
ncbi:MAG: sensor histidine kinase [Ruminococcus sp.]